MFKKIAMALVFFTAPLYSVVGVIDILIMGNKILILIGDLHETNPLNTLHKNLFRTFMRRCDKRTTKVFIEDSLENLLEIDPAALGMLSKEARLFFLNGLTENLRSEGFSVENIEARQLPVSRSYDFVEYWHSTFIPKFLELKKIRTENPLLQRWYDCKIDSIFRQLPIAEDLLAICKQQRILTHDCFDVMSRIPQSYLLDVTLMHRIQQALCSVNTIVVCAGGEHTHQIREALIMQGFVKVNSFYADKELRVHADTMRKLSEIRSVDEQAAAMIYQNQASVAVETAFFDPYNQRKIAEQLCALPRPLFHLPYTQTEFDQLMQEGIALEKQQARG